MTTHQGSCHCGRIAFEVDGDIAGAATCNCSICRRRGSIMWFVPRESLRLSTPESAMSTYKFHKHVIEHHFCPTCGCAPFGEGVGPDGSKMASVNLRCLPEVDLAALGEIPEYDGKSF